MKKIGLFLFQTKEYLILTLAIIISLILIFSNDNSQIKFFRGIAIGSFGTLQSGFSAIPNVFEIQKENKFIRENNIKLSNEIANLKEAKLENIRLTKLLSLKQSNNLGIVSGKIVNKSLIQIRNTITINIGEVDSVKVNMPVITDDGLVGKIVATSKNYSIAQILLNKDLKFAVKCQRNRIDGISNFDGFQTLSVSNVPKSADINPGDIFVTSEYSNNFPAGIPIGTVIEIGNLDNLFRKIIIKSAVNFEVLEEVFILMYVPDKEKMDLEKSFLTKY